MLEGVDTGWGMVRVALGVVVVWVVRQTEIPPLSTAANGEIVLRDAPLIDSDVCVNSGGVTRATGDVVAEDVVLIGSFVSFGS